MKGTNYCPAFPISMLLGWLAAIGLSVYFIIYFIANYE